MGVKFRYIGEYPPGKSELMVFGCIFSPEAAVEVPSRFVGKARGNRFFEEVAEAAPSASVDAKNAFVPDKPYDKDELITLAAERGVKIDKRWGLEKMIQAIETANLKGD